MNTVWVLQLLRAVNVNVYRWAINFLELVSCLFSCLAYLLFPTAYAVTYDILINFKSTEWKSVCVSVFLCLHLHCCCLAVTQFRTYWNEMNSAKGVNLEASAWLCVLWLILANEFTFTVVHISFRTNLIYKLSIHLPPASCSVLFCKLQHLRSSQSIPNPYKWL